MEKHERELKSDIAECMEWHGVALRPALAVCAIVAGRYGEARNWLADIDPPETPAKPEAAPETDVAAPQAKKPEKAFVFSEKTAKRKPASKGERACTACGESKGVTGFAAGQAVCRKCVKTKGGKVKDPVLRIVRCRDCGRGVPESNCNPDGICEKCTGR